jgi:deoxyribodipyrimidine photo-lyase
MRILHWFRSDLRLHDNTALAAAARRAERLVTVFVFDPALLRSERRSLPRIRFLLDCVSRVAKNLEKRGGSLVVRSGDPRKIIPALAEEARTELVTWNRDYGPYAQARDQAVTRALERIGTRVVTYKDRVIFESDEILTRSGDAYSVYSPYRRAWWSRFTEDPPEMAGPLRLPSPLGSIARGSPPTPADLGADDDETELPTGGRAAARRRLRSFLEHGISDYETQRDQPAIDGTSRLSPYLRLGVISVRECVHEALDLAEREPSTDAGVRCWVDELVWREFYSAILANHPRVLRESFKPEYDRLEWERPGKHFAAWCEGRTGFPFVDAAMRQLSATGWMHNRARMVVASFLTKDLLIDWRLGERFFMQRLVDGDPANNNGGWQWAASTGTDAQPYFRIFNPVSQGERFDPKGDYVRRWVPELSGLEGKRAHRPWDSPDEAPEYPPPCVDHAERRKLALERFEAARRRRG